MIEDAKEYTIRTFVNGDENVLVHLFNNEHRKLVGFVPRTPEYWRWCCLGRLDVDEKSIAIVHKKEAIVGYAVVGKSGNIWELCYNSEYEGKIIVSKLLTWIIDYARSVESDAISLNAFAKDDIVRKACQELDFAEGRSEAAFFSVLDLPRLICDLIGSRRTIPDTGSIFWFKLKDCPPWCNDSFGIQLGQGKVSVLKDAVNNPDITIDTSMSTVVALIFGIESISKALITSKLRFYPLRKIRRLLKFFSLLQTKSPWFIPRADIG